MRTMYGELVDYAATLPDVKPYHQETRFTWLLQLGADGSLAARELTELTTSTSDRKGRSKLVVGVWHSTPSVVRSSGVEALVPYDGLGYVLGWCDESSKPDRVADSHQAYRDLVIEWATHEGVDDPIAQALQSFVHQSPEIQRPERWTSKDNVLVQVDGVNAHAAPSLVGYWVRHVEERKGSGEHGTCLICGRSGALIETIPQMVKGPYVPGGQSSGVAPISINAAPFGFDLTVGLVHVPICTACARSIPLALNSLLSDERRVRRSKDAATTWWIAGETQFDVFTLLDQAREEDIASLFDSVGSGVASQGQMDVARFNSLVISGNGPRLVVNDWTSLPLDELRANVAGWFYDTEVEPLGQGGHRHQSLWLLATATGRFDVDRGRYLPLGDTAGHHPHGIQESLGTVALHGSPAPSFLASHLLQRIRADHHVDDQRAALLQLALRRNYRKGTLMPGLDLTCTDPCYVAGRLFAIYADLQYAAATADGGTAPNATFADKHLAGAIADPRTAITAGEKQAAAWLNKLRRRKGDYFYQRDIDQVVSLLQPGRTLPVRASTEEQAMFVMGYHHERAHRSHEREAARQQRLLLGADAEPTTSPTQN